MLKKFCLALNEKKLKISEKKSEIEESEEKNRVVLDYDDSMSDADLINKQVRMNTLHFLQSQQVSKAKQETKNKLALKTKSKKKKKVQ